MTCRRASPGVAVVVDVVVVAAVAAAVLGGVVGAVAAVFLSLWQAAWQCHQTVAAMHQITNLPASNVAALGYWLRLASPYFRALWTTLRTRL